MKPYRVDYECPECGEDCEVKVWPYKPAITHRAVEDCEPPEGGYCEPDSCEGCGCEIEYDDVQEHE